MNADEKREAARKAMGIVGETIRVHDQITGPAMHIIADVGGWRVTFTRNGFDQIMIKIESDEDSHMVAIVPADDFREASAAVLKGIDFEDESDGIRTHDSRCTLGPYHDGECNVKDWRG